MTRHNRKILGLTVGAIALVAIAGAAGAVINNRIDDHKATEIVKPIARNESRSETIHWNKPAPVQPAPQVASGCNDANVVGYGLGALAGGVLGHQLGKGKGKDVATVGGAAAGALAGGQYLPTRNVLCPH